MRSGTALPTATRVDGSGICVRGSAHLGQTVVQTATGLFAGHAFSDTLPTITKGP
ncbi:hypothetical protein [Streptosporangium sp. KLBMP 9127]|nr:hypothetical protein [Streptosporangium sp. KLBMP 9127]